MTKQEQAENKGKTILHLCADIGSDSQPYRDAGYNVICVGKDQDVRTYEPPENVYGVIANPPCTMFSFARTRAKTPRNLRKGMELVQSCLRVIWECQYQTKSEHQRKGPLKFWAIENPNASLTWFLGKPALIYQPYEYGERYSKSTCLWGVFNTPPKNPVSLNEDEKHRARVNNRVLPKLDGLKQSDRRSVCSARFAKAFFEVNR